MSPEIVSRCTFGRSLALVALVLSLLFALPLAAQQGDSGTRGEENPQQLAAEADEAFERGEYEEAIAKYSRAYELDPNIVLLYNLSRSHARAGNLETAREKALLVRERGAGRLPPQIAAKNEAYISSYDSALRARSTATDVRVAAERREQRDDGFSYRPGMLGWAGIGAAALGTGLLIGSLGVNGALSDDLASYREDRRRVDNGELSASEADLEGRFDNLERRQSTGRILLFGGSVLFATGATLLVLDFLGSRDEADSEPSDTTARHRTPSWTLVGGVGTDGFTLGLSGRF